MVLKTACPQCGRVKSLRIILKNMKSEATARSSCAADTAVLEACARHMDADEFNAYSTLLRMGGSNTKRLARESGLCKGRIYQVLNKLARQDVVYVSGHVEGRGHPLVYRSHRPAYALAALEMDTHASREDELGRSLAIFYAVVNEEIESFYSLGATVWLRDVLQKLRNAGVRDTSFVQPELEKFGERTRTDNALSYRTDKAEWHEYLRRSGRVAVDGDGNIMLPSYPRQETV